MLALYWAIHVNAAILASMPLDKRGRIHHLQLVAILHDFDGFGCGYRNH